ncbi:MAG: GreA/GreB family elongation factor [Verrucomicrobiia bacterium]
MREEFEKLVAAGKFSRQHVEPLVQLAKAGYCMHRSWGFGKITAVDTLLCRFIVDFPSKTGHSMDLAFAAESLKPIPAEHILARKASDINSLRQIAALHHLDLIKIVLESYGGKATVDQIQQVLVPDVIADDWKKWWEVAKRELKKDGHFQVPLKKSEPIVYQAQEISLQQRLVAEFRAAKGLKAKLAVVTELLKNWPDLNDPAAIGQELIPFLNTDIASHQRTQTALALEAVFLRDEVRAAAGTPPIEGELTEAGLWAQTTKPGQVLDAIPASKHKRALQSFKEAHLSNWVEILINSLNSMSTKLCGEAAMLLIQEGHLQDLKDHLARLISQHAASSELLLWLAKERSDSFADILGPEVFRAMLTTMERDQFNEKKSNRLRDYILDDQDLLVELIGSADLEVIKDLTRALQLSPCFDDMDKRSLLARIVKTYPAVQSLISGEHSKHEAVLVVSWESLERRKNEYQELVHKKIPANSKEIAVARSYGDLRENHEYKAAKEMHKLLMRRKSELENQLVRARGTDFTEAKGDQVGIGTVVEATNLDAQHPETFAILGAWDFDPEKHVISYLSPIAQAMLGHKQGDEVEFEMDGAKKRYRIDSVAPISSARQAPQVPAKQTSSEPQETPAAG